MSVAKNLVRSWLRANKIPFSKSSLAGCDFTIQGRLGDVEVRLCDRNDETAPGGVIDVLASDITHKKQEVAFAAYHRITEAGGFGKPIPVDRGPQPEQKLCYTDDPFLVCVRHTAYRRSPDPAPEKYVAYDKVMHKACWTFYNLNNEACRRWGKSVEDLRTYAMVLLAIFVAQIEDDEKDAAYNEQTLYVWLRQRFAEIYKITTMKERSTMPDADTVSIALIGASYRGYMTFDSEGDATPIVEATMPLWCGHEIGCNIDGTHDIQAEDVEYKKRNRKLNTSNPTARKASAAKMLNENLAALGHDKMVYALGFAHQNILINSDARREAGKRLRAHVSECEQCAATVKNAVACAKSAEDTRLATHTRDCEKCSEHRFLLAALTEVDVNEESSSEAPSSEE